MPLETSRNSWSWTTSALTVGNGVWRHNRGGRVNNPAIGSARLGSAMYPEFSATEVTGEREWRRAQRPDGQVGLSRVVSATSPGCSSRERGRKTLPLAYGGRRAELFAHCPQQHSLSGRAKNTAPPARQCDMPLRHSSVGFLYSLNATRMPSKRSKLLHEVQLYVFNRKFYFPHCMAWIVLYWQLVTKQ